MTQLVRERLSTLPRKNPLWLNSKVRLLNCMGMRAQESPKRSKLPVLAFDKSASNGRREVWNWLPIHAWTVDQVWARIRETGVPHHFAYDLGMPRLSCCFCIFAPVSVLIGVNYAKVDCMTSKLLSDAGLCGFEFGQV